MVESVK